METREAQRSPAIAIIGVACRFPGSNDAASYWDSIARNETAFRPIPSERWDTNALRRLAARGADSEGLGRGALLDAIFDFDPLFFGISPRDARLMDPQQRLLLEVTWEATEDAGYAGSAMLNTETGVFVGSTRTDYQSRIAPSLTPRDYSAGLGNANALLANRISALLDLHGPSVFCDTLCSSSMVALHLACQSIAAGECRMAIVGGVNVLLSPTYYVLLDQLRLLSPTGTCRPFDERADGFVPGEGAASIVVKALDDAVADGDNIYAVIRGSAVAHRGRSLGLTVPDPSAQVRLLERAMQKSGVAADSIGVVEAMGASNLMSDTSEIQCLIRTVGNRDVRAYGDQACQVTCVKANVGHLEPVSGLAGLIKTVYALKDAIKPGLLGAERPASAGDAPGLSFTPEHTPWPERVRRAGVNSFGLSGTDVHVVMENYLAPPREEPRRPETLVIPLSARSAASLRALAERFAHAVGAHGDGWPLLDLCYTAAVGRAYFNHRLAVEGGSAPELRARLLAFASSVPSAGLHYGTTDPARSWYAEKAPADGPFDAGGDAMRGSGSAEIAEDFVNGRPVNWARVYRGLAVRRRSLPTAVFERATYQVAPAPAPAVRVASHPLLGSPVELGSS